MTVTITPAPAAGGLPAEPAEVVLAARGIRKVFPGTLALDNVSLSVRKGEIHALLGENGAGKSTLIKCICGAYSTDAGALEVGGRPVTITTPREAAQAGIAVVHQHFNLVPSLTVAENLWLGEALPRRAGGFVAWPRLYREAEAILSRLGVDISPAADISDLRPDQLAMLSIARAVSRDARIVILDEPTNALLPHEVDRLFDRMRSLAAQGHSFLYVSHRLAEVFEIADRATVLRDGRNAGDFERGAMDRRSVVEAIIGKKGGHAERRSVNRAGDKVVLQVGGLAGRRLRNLDFTLRAGEILGIAGLPGSGAEEVLDLLFGRHRRSAGRIAAHGAEVPLRSPAEAIAAGIALVPQDRLAESIFHGESIRSNVSMPSLSRFVRNPVLRFVNRGRESAAVTEVTSRMRVRMPGIEAPIDGLSGGNQQKVVLGRWLSTGARIFLLNSPTAAVDVGAKAEIYQLIDQLAAEGAAVVFASTEIEEYPLVCDRVIVLSEGVPVGELAGEAVKEGDIMTLAAGGAAADVQH